MNCSGEKGKSFFVISFPGLHKLQLLYPFQCTAFLGEPLCNFFFHSCFTTQRSNKFNTQLPRSLLFMLPSDSATLLGTPCKDHCVPLSLVTNALWFLGVPKGDLESHGGFQLHISRPRTTQKKAGVRWFKGIYLAVEGEKFPHLPTAQMCFKAWTISTMVFSSLCWYFSSQEQRNGNGSFPVGMLRCVLFWAMFPLVLPVIKIIYQEQPFLMLITGFKSLPKGRIKFYAIFYVRNPLFDEIHI